MQDRFERFSTAIAEISRYWHKLATEEMEKYGLKGTHSVYLTALASSGEGLTAPQLCAACGKDKSDVSRMMNTMEKKGLVTKEGGHQNRYGGVYILTAQGMEAANHVRSRADRAVEIAGKDLSEEERRIFYHALEVIVVNMRKLSKEGIPEE